MQFCEEIKRVRQERLMSQEMFAKELGVSFATVNRWETGKTVPSYKALKLIDSYCKGQGITFNPTEWVAVKGK